MLAIAAMGRSYREHRAVRFASKLAPTGREIPVSTAQEKAPHVRGSFVSARPQPRRDSGWRSKRTPARPVDCSARMLAWSVPSGVSRTAR